MSDDLGQRLDQLERENAYLRWLVWKLSLRDLATQHHKYEVWLKRTYAEDRAKDLGLHSYAWGTCKHDITSEGRQ